MSIFESEFSLAQTETDKCNTSSHSKYPTNTKWGCQYGFEPDFYDGDQLEDAVKNMKECANFEFQLGFEGGAETPQVQNTNAWERLEDQQDSEEDDSSQLDPSECEDSPLNPAPNVGLGLRLYEGILFEDALRLFYKTNQISRRNRPLEIDNYIEFIFGRPASELITRTTEFVTKTADRGVNFRRFDQFIKKYLSLNKDFIYNRFKKAKSKTKKPDAFKELAKELGLHLDSDKDKCDVQRWFGVHIKDGVTKNSIEVLFSRPSLFEKIVCKETVDAVLKLLNEGTDKDIQTNIIKSTMWAPKRAAHPSNSVSTKERTQKLPFTYLENLLSARLFFQEIQAKHLWTQHEVPGTKENDQCLLLKGVLTHIEALIEMNPAGKHYLQQWVAGAENNSKGPFVVFKVTD